MRLKGISVFFLAPALILALVLMSGVCRAEIWATTGGPPWDEPVLSLLTVGTTVYAGMGEGRVYKYDGASWKHVGIPKTSGEVRALVTIGGDLYAGKENIYRYDGTSWSNTVALGDDAGATGDDDDLAYQLASAGGHICAGTYYGRVYKYDGASWLYTGRPGNRTYHIWSMTAVGDVAYAGTWWGTVYKCAISCGDKFSLGTGTLHAGRQFNLGVSLAKDITRPSDIYLLVEAPPYGVFTIRPDGSLERGIKPIYRNLPGLGAPLSTSIKAAVALPEALRGSTLTFYIVAVDAGKVPPVSGLAALNAESPYVNAFDKRSAVVE